MLDIKQMRYFQQLNKDKSITKAAKNLFITQQALSKIIKNAENELHLPLIIRNANGIELTEYGEILVNKSKPILDAVDDLAEELLMRSEQDHGKVIAGFTYGSISALSLDVLLDFKNKYTKINLEFSDSSDRTCERLVLSEAWDVACIVGPADTSLFDSITWRTDATYMLISKKNPLSTMEEITMNDLKHENFITMDHNFNAPKLFCTICRKAGFEPKITFTSSEYSLVVEMASLNRGIFIIPEHGINKITDPNIQVIPFPDPSLAWPLCLITKKGKHLSRATKTFINYIIRRTKL